MPYDLSRKLVVGVSSRALFDLSRENHIFEERGIEAYDTYQIENASKPLGQGTALHLVRKLLLLNEHLPKDRQVEVIVMSRASFEAGRRIKNSVEHYGLSISRYSFTRGAPVAQYLPAYCVDLFLSAEPEDVGLAFAADIPAAVTFAQPRSQSERDDPQIRIAFDGDGVLFGSESERVYQEGDLKAFHEHEKLNSKKPMSRGPMAKLLSSLVYMQRHLPKGIDLIRTALITARNAPADDRVFATLDAWRLRIDEHHYLGGVKKEGVLRAFAPDIFFDDQSAHCWAASNTICTAQVPSNLFTLARSEAPLCEKCGSIMKKRIARRGTDAGKPFWGCSNFPNCTQTYSI